MRSPTRDGGLAETCSRRGSRPGHERPDLVFGRGSHYGLGANLAEMQAQHAARAVLRKYPHLRVTGPREAYSLRLSWITYALAERPMVTTAPDNADTGRISL